MSNKKGYFIVLEGIDGAGTSTQTRLLAEYFIKKGLDNIVVTFEPWVSEDGVEIRRRLKEEKNPLENGSDFANLFLKDSVTHNKKVIKPSLEKGKIVISDRYRASSFAYQPAQGIYKKIILESHLREDLEIPDINFYLKLPVKQALKRTGKGVEKFEQQEFLEKVSSNYEWMMNKIIYFNNVKIIDASKPIKNVHEKIYNHVRKILKIK